MTFKELQTKYDDMIITISEVLRLKLIQKL